MRNNKIRFVRYVKSVEEVLDNEKYTFNSSGVSFTNLLFLVFLVLKLTNVIDWSWWWVTAPLWGPFVLIIGITALILLIGLFILTIDIIFPISTHKIDFKDEDDE